MKTKLFQILGVVAIGLFSFSSCEKECDPGYEGSDCKTEMRTKFLATYTVGGTSVCDVTGSDTFSNISLVVGPSASSVTKITIVVAGVFNLTATVDGTAFTIDPSTSGVFSYTGSGSINGSNLSLTLNEVDSDVPETCIYTLTGSKQ